MKNFVNDDSKEFKYKSATSLAKVQKYSLPVDTHCPDNPQPYYKFQL